MNTNHPDVRIFPGHATCQKTEDGRDADPDAFYFEPADYLGDVLFSPAYATADEAAKAAREFHAA